MNFSTVVPMLNSVDRLLNLLKLSLSTDITEFEYNNLAGYLRCSQTFRRVCVSLHSEARRSASASVLTDQALHTMLCELPHHSSSHRFLFI